MSNLHQTPNPKNTLYSFFKPRDDAAPSITIDDTPPILIERRPSKTQRVENREADTSFVRDPGLRLQIWQHPVNERDEHPVNER